ncbi:MAG: hypothetical protein MJY55_02570 [Bacteroidales bacterium]|nr:hypothetical protein [Bacteroidales bacterium]
MATKLIDKGMKKAILFSLALFWAIAAGAVTDLSKDGTANCYMVRSGSREYSFNASVKGNGVAPYGENASIDAREVKGVRLIWQDSDIIDAASVKYASGRVTFRTGAKAREGNAVIALFSDRNCSDGKCLWSWHIWMTDASDCEMAGVRFLDRNLGAASPALREDGRNGLFYQWGRKDPFPQTGEVTVSAPGKAPVEYTVSHPQTFIVRSGRWMDCDFSELWCDGARREDERTLRMTPSTKTMYDPCPVGYHVPNPVDIYAIRARGGHSFVKAGARWYDLVPLVPDKVGELGYYWTALTDKDSGSRSVDFYIWNVGTGIAMKSHYYNGSAFPVRPQKF